MCLLIFIAGLVVFALAVYYLPWWAWLIIAPVGAIALFLARGRIFERLFMIPFRMKGKVLRKANAQVHAIRRIEKPALPVGESNDDASENDGEEPEAPGIPIERHYYEIDVTISPKPNSGPFRLWAPHDLQMLPARASAMSDSGEACEVLEVKVIPPADLSAEERTQFEEGAKFHGPLRLTLTVGAANDLQSAAFNYYFHKFGRVDFPGETAN
jgi:hypothetical protein